MICMFILDVCIKMLICIVYIGCVYQNDHSYVYIGCVYQNDDLYVYIGCVYQNDDLYRLYWMCVSK